MGLTQFNNEYLMFGDEYIGDPVYSVIIRTGIGGTITASPMTGAEGTTVSFSNTADEGYIFDSYSFTGGASIWPYTGGTRKFTNSNITASGKFRLPIPAEIKFNWGEKVKVSLNKTANSVYWIDEDAPAHEPQYMTAFTQEELNALYNYNSPTGGVLVPSDYYPPDANSRNILVHYNERPDDVTIYFKSAQSASNYGMDFKIYSGNDIELYHGNFYGNIASSYFKYTF